MRTLRIYLFLFIFSVHFSCTGQNGQQNNAQQDNQASVTSFADKQARAMDDRQQDEQTTDIPPQLDFSDAAQATRSGVVHIMATKQAQRGRSPFEGLPPEFRRFFNIPENPSPQPQQGSGSGVIISEDGYIVTNNHVVAGADELQVNTYDNQSFEAEVVGTDPTTDLALLKVEASGLDFVEFGNMESVEVGDWVLAVGNPFNLTSTVTAGIVSAISRSINILREQAAIEAFIQTDAAVNPGNSGGALVNLDGKLIGINTAIASPTGAYAGYSFAVPIDLTQKVVDDLLNYGVVQRGYLGVFIRDLNNQLIEENDLDINQGVYVDSLVDDGAAEMSGIQKGDVIVEVEDNQIETAAELQSAIAQKRPGDEVEITVRRNGSSENVNVTLRNRQGGTDFVEETERNMMQQLGINIRNLTDDQLEQLGIDGGVQVVSISPRGTVGRTTQMREGFIITGVDRQEIGNLEELQETFEGKSGEGVMVSGYYPGNPNRFYYAFGIPE